MASGVSISREKLAHLLQANGYFRVDTVAEAGEFAMRGSLVDLIPAGSEDGLRLDFFRRRDRNNSRFQSRNAAQFGTVKEFALLPAVETLMDEDAIRRFRTQYREHVRRRLQPAIRCIRRYPTDGGSSGMDHWLPLFEERLETLFDHLGDDLLVLRDAGTVAAAEQRFDAIKDYYENRVKAQSARPEAIARCRPNCSI